MRSKKNISGIIWKRLFTDHEETVTLKIKELEPIVREYASYFPGLQVWERDMLVRREGPLLQGILFNRSSGNDYQPEGFFYNVIDPGMTPGTMLWVQDLPWKPSGVPGRRVKIENHASERDEIVEGLRNYIQPSLSQPLKLEEVVSILEEIEKPDTNETFLIAVIYNYLENAAKAKQWIQEHQRLAESVPTWKEQEAQRMEVLKKITDWLNEDKVREHMDALIEKRCNELGLTQ